MYPAEKESREKSIKNLVIRNLKPRYRHKNQTETKLYAAKSVLFTLKLKDSDSPVHQTVLIKCI